MITKVTLARQYLPVLATLLPPKVDINALIAVFAVEASGQGIDPITKLPIIRFEVHQFFKLFGQLHRELFDVHFRFDAKETWKEHYVKPESTSAWIKLHGGPQATEWLAFNTATNMDAGAASAAIQATSFGVGQIMGFNYGRAGYMDPFSMYLDSHDINKQLEMVVNFIESDTRLLKAITNKDWATFARYYNGTGQVPKYSAWLKEAYDLAASMP
jgi:hypothetical protein